MAEVGDAWRVLIIRDALSGLRRFDDFRRSTGIAPNILARRLAVLVADGLLARRIYQRHPTRHEYVATEKARDFGLVIAALVDWGTRWLSPEGATVSLVSRTSGRPLAVALVDAATGRRQRLDVMQAAAGPAAGPEIVERFGKRAVRRMGRQ